MTVRVGVSELRLRCSYQWVFMLYWEAFADAMYFFLSSMFMVLLEAKRRSQEKKCSVIWANKQWKCSHNQGGFDFFLLALEGSLSFDTLQFLEWFWSTLFSWCDCCWHLAPSWLFPAMMVSDSKHFFPLTTTDFDLLFTQADYKRNTFMFSFCVFLLLLNQGTILADLCNSKKISYDVLLMICLQHWTIAWMFFSIKCCPV